MAYRILLPDAYYKSKFSGAEIDRRLTDVDNKQDIISDLDEIREGAAKGETAYQLPEDGIPMSDLSQAVQDAIAKAETVEQAVEAIQALIPPQASDDNQLADKNFVNSSVATNTANFIGTFNSVAELEAYSGVLTNNDYAFVITTDAYGNTAYDRYKYNASEEEWLYEYTLNNSSFTAEQWAAINSGITASLVSKLSALPTNDELTTALSGKQDVISDLTTIRSNASAGASMAAFFGTNTVNSVASIPVNKSLVIATISADSQLSLADTPQTGMHISLMITNTGADAIVVSLPTAQGNVILNDTDIAIGVASTVRVNIWSDGTNVYLDGQGETFIPPRALRFKNAGANEATIKRVNSNNNPDVQYSTNNGKTWIPMANDTAITIAPYRSIYVRGNNPLGFSADTTHFTSFVMTGSIKCSGNVMHLLDYTTPEDQLLTIPNDYCFFKLFIDCTALTTAPSLPATTLTNNCYQGMFRGCTSLTAVPTLPATTLATGCYQGMFRDCTALITVLSLPATTLATNCYNDMFRDCTSLTTVPTLPATTLVTGCYPNMFYGCTSLNAITCLSESELGSTYSSYWLYNVASTGTFTVSATATWADTVARGASTIPTGWTVVHLT